MLYPQYQKKPQFRGRWEREHRRLCQCLVSVDIDTYRLGKNSAEGAQTSRTPMSSCQDYASRRPQEPWKYLDIFFAPPLVCIATQCIIFCGWETRFQVARGRTLKGWSAFQPLSRRKLRPHPNATDSSSLNLHPCHVVYHCFCSDFCAVVYYSKAWAF